MAVYFEYGQTEMDYLSSKDKAMAEAIERIGLIKREVTPSLFEALACSIVGQQISTKAQITICARIRDGLGNISAENIVKCSEEYLQSFGISFRKAQYIKSAAEAVMSGELDIDSLKEKSDEEVIAELIKLKGVGKWTAEMLLLFSMSRPDIVSQGDLAIIRGMKVLYHHREITDKLFKKYSRRYSPYGSVASLYLWEIAGEK